MEVLLNYLPEFIGRRGLVDGIRVLELKLLKQSCVRVRSISRFPFPFVHSIFPPPYCLIFSFPTQGQVAVTES